MWRSARSGSAAAAVLVAGALVLGGCCGADAEPRPAAGGGRDGQFRAYLDCLRDNGVVLTRPSGRPARSPGAGRSHPGGTPPADRPARRSGGVFGKPPGVDDATWEKARHACGPLRPARRPGARGPGAAYRSCLRDRGVPPGDPDRTGDPGTAAALARCAPLRPGGAPRAD
ncbi:hypothetical protein GCM10010124_06880 [Pilimelia terevasa]|uniref:Secreted protein n=1 Tax=Pilimelia terevasa TaxID=53372 RepID=A0A8J3FF76_9ACTN|nr:hypothetical protein [Pilimelia terevasa]GGK16953.1 hypothetical protein GCM10010124_06880 [Pilimelia terevasa]